MSQNLSNERRPERRVIDRRCEPRRAEDRPEPEIRQAAERRVKNPYEEMSDAERRRLDALGFNRRQGQRRRAERRRSERRDN